MTNPIPLPDLCIIPANGLWPPECWARLNSYDIVAEANTDIAKLNASALRNSDEAYDEIVEAGKLQSQLAQIRQEILDQERQAHMRDLWFYRALVALGIVGVIL